MLDANQKREITKSLMPLMLEQSQALQSCTSALISQLVEAIQVLLNAEHKCELDGMAYVTISFMNTSLYFGKPVFRIDIYEENPELCQSPILTQTIDAQNFIISFNSIEKELLKFCPKLTPMELEQASWLSIKVLLFYYANFLKYDLRDNELNTCLNILAKKQSVVISFGEYMDWQKAVVGVTSEVDIFKVINKKFVFKHFENKIYSNKNIKKLFFAQCRFINCSFDHSDFLHMDARDCIFDKCSFIYAAWDQCVFWGSIFSACNFESLHIKNSVFGFDGVSPQKVTEFYQPVQIDRCSFHKVMFIDSNLSQCNMNECTTTYTEILNCNVYQASLNHLINKGDK